MTDSSEGGRLVAPRNANYAALSELAAELVAAGVRHACITPGNRSAPLALCLAQTEGLRCWSQIDERSSGFFALGLARATDTPVALVCTSGSAVVNLFPAIVEAHHAGVPLVVLTADRPQELRDCSAPQTIDQSRIFGTHVRWYADTGLPEATGAGIRHLCQLADRAVAEACGPPAGVAHLNVPLRDPLDPGTPDGTEPVVSTVDRSGGPRVRRSLPQSLSPAALDEIARTMDGASRPLIVAGPMPTLDRGRTDAVLDLATVWGAPVFAESTSNTRRQQAAVVDCYEAIARSPARREALRPDVVLRLGSPPTSRALGQWLASDPVPTQIAVDPVGAWSDPSRTARHLVQAPVESLCRALAGRLCGSGGAFAQEVTAVAAEISGVLDRALGAEERLFEAHVVRALARVLPETASVYVGNSLAVRELDFFWPASAPPVHVWSSRGTNGIDGFASSVLGVAAGGRPVVGLCGDLSFLHDVGGLLAAKRHDLRACFVVLNNDGGGIFDLLPVSGAGPLYDEFFVTAHGLELAPLVESFGGAHRRVTNRADLDACLAEGVAEPGLSVVEVHIDRGTSRDAHRRIWETLAEERS